MCQINPRRLNPLGAANGNVPVWNDTTKRWEPVTVGGFDPTQNQDITGEWSFNMPINLKNVVSSITPVEGVTISALQENYFTIGNTTGALASIDVSSVTGNRTYTLPDQTGTIALTSQIPGNILRTTNPLGASLQTITDGVNNSPLRLSTTLARFTSDLLIGGATTATARLHVRGDGISHTARFENSSSQSLLSIGNGISTGVVVTIGGGINLYGRYTDGTLDVSASPIGVYAGYQSNHQNDWATTSHYFTSPARVFNNPNVITGTAGIARFVQTFAIENSNSATINYRPIAIEYTINNTVASSGAATGIFINVTPTNFNGMSHNFVDFRFNDTSRFRVNETNVRIRPDLTSGLYLANIISWGDFLNNQIQGTANGSANSTDCFITLSLASGSSVFRFTSNFMQTFGGTNNLFPALKRNGSGLEVRLADDSGFANLGVNRLHFGNVTTGYINTLLPGNNINFVFNDFGLANEALSISFNNPHNSTSGTRNLIRTRNPIIANSAGSSNIRLLNLDYTINNSGVQTGTLTGILLNAIETNLNGMVHDLIDLQVGGDSRFRVANSSAAIFTNNGLVLNQTSLNASAILQADSTTRGFLPPRMTTTQRDAIASPATGLQLYNNSQNSPNFYNGSGWLALIGLKQYNAGETGLTPTGNLEFSHNGKTYKILVEEI